MRGGGTELREDEIEEERAIERGAIAQDGGEKKTTQADPFIKG